MAVNVKRSASPVRRIAPMTPARALVAMVRPSQVALIWAIYLAGVLLGLTRPGASAEVWPIVIAAALITFAAAAAHLVNEAEDAATDRLTERTAFSGGSGGLEASGLDASVPLRLGLLLAGLVATATWIAWVEQALTGAAVTIMLVGLVGALFYSLPPLAAMRHGWGEPLNAVLGGLLLPLAGVAVVSGRIEIHDVVAFLPLMLVVLASVMATAWPDRRADAATGKATLQVRLRPMSLRRIHAGATVAFVGAVIVSAITGVTPLALAALLVLPALVMGVATYTRRASPLPNVAAMVGLVLVLLVANAFGLVNRWSG